MIQQVVNLLSAMIEVEELPTFPPPPSSDQVEMLTIKECAQQISGLSEHTVRQLVLQNKLPQIRTGQGKRGKNLAPKSALLEYLRTVA
ncbi:MAG: helix-turn-helix domain-containing protein [Ruminococcus sp.]|nr:helix-turn-helix domain-containing protein [Ruminococcus sp.]